MTGVDLHLDSIHFSAFPGGCAHLARPLFREVDTTQLEEAEAVKLMEDALRVCYYRDKNSINKFILGKVTAEGTTVSEPFTLDTNWNYKHFVDPAQFSQGSW